MGTHHTGIPLTRRNIQPPPIPVVRMVINEVVPNYANDTKVFYVTITGSNGYYATYVPISVSQPIILNNLQYGTYYISQNAESGYTQISVSPSSFTLSADNPQQTVTITTVKNVGQVTVTKTITGVTEDETYFDITITGIDNEYVEQFGQVRLDEPLIFYDLPFGSYVITESEAEGYTLDSITPSGFELNVNVLTVDVEIVNDIIVNNALELTFKVIDDVVQLPPTIIDPTQVSEWNTFFDLPTNGTAFSSVIVDGNVVKLYGGSGITLKDGLFYSQSYLIKFIDNANCVVRTNYVSFRGAFELTEFNAPAITYVGLESFEQCYAINNIYIPSVTNLGGTVGNNDVFANTEGLNIELTIPTVLMTCNSGNPDGDIQTLIATNTVTIYDPLGNQIYPI